MVPMRRRGLSELYGILEHRLDAGAKTLDPGAIETRHILAVKQNTSAGQFLEAQHQFRERTLVPGPRV